MPKAKQRKKLDDFDRDWEDFDIRDDLPDVSRLADGRLFLMKEDGDWKVLDNGEWKDPEGITLGMVTDSMPLRNSEIEDLIARGILPQ